MDKPQQRQLTELTPAQLAEILRAGRRTPESRELTKVFLDQVADLLQERIGRLDADVGVRTKSDERSQGIQFIDRAFFYLTRDLIGDAATTRTQVVAGNARALALTVLLTPGRIWWGLHVWGSQNFTTTVHEAFRRLDLIESDDQVQSVSGALGAQQAWPSGGTFAIGRDLTADQVAALPDLGSLVATIVSELVNLCLRVSPHISDLRQELGGATSRKHIWLFQTNPKYYDLVASLKTQSIGDEDSWTVSRYRDEMQAGDPVILWQGGAEAGIYAIGELSGAPHRRDQAPASQELAEKPYLRSEWEVTFRYTHILEEPILREKLKADLVLADLEVLKFAQATNYRVTLEQWEALQALIGRNSQADARQIIELLLPDPDVRRTCLGLFADAIVQAYQTRPSGWSISLFPNLVRLNVGRIRAHDISANQVHLVLATNALSKQAQAFIQDHAETSANLYDSLPDTTDARFAAGELSNLLPFVRDAHLQIVSKAAQVVQNRTSYYKSHSPDVLVYLRAFLGREELPDPDYQDHAPVDSGQTTRIRHIPPVAAGDVLAARLAYEGLHFTRWQVATFYTALQTKGFVILSGISGTGKTKLAQHFAASLPQPTEAALPPSDDVQVITVQPYMLRYSRVIIPAQVARLFEPPEAGKGLDVTVKFDGRSQPCRLVHVAYPGTHYLQLLFRGATRSWFKQSFKEGDALYLEVEPDADGGLGELHFAKTAPMTPGSKPVQSGKNHLFMPVRPDWRDSKSLLGYYNPLTGAYEWTPFLRFLLRAEQNYRTENTLAWFVILDEMNLAHVEYYFADLLSVLESGRDEDGWTREPLRLGYPDEAEGDLPPRELRLPPNLYIIGTVNVDETTHAFSAKVLDRAFTLELTDADFSTYLSATAPGQASLSDGGRQAILRNFTRNGAFARIDKPAIAAHLVAYPQVRHRLQTLNALLRPHDLHFGYRVFDEIVAFLAIAQDNKLYESLDGEDAAFDAAVLMKVLPKFHGSRSRLEAPLCAVLAWCVNPDAPDPQAMQSELQQVESGETVTQALAQIQFRYPKTAERVRRMMSRLYTDGFAAFG